MTTPHLYVGRELPGLELHWADSINDPVDLSDGYTFAVSLEQNGTTTALSGAVVTANPSPTLDTGSSADVPTLAVAFTAGALDAITAGPAVLRVAANNGGRDRLGVWRLVVGS
jgi:hypothetical protein